MTDNTKLAENFYDEETEAQGGGGGKALFGELQLFAPRVNYKKGSHFVIPGITGGKHDKLNSDGFKMFEKYEFGNKGILYVLALRVLTKEKEEYFLTRKYTSWANRNGLYEWKKYAIPGLKNGLSIEQYKALFADRSGEIVTGQKYYVQIEANEGEEIFSGNAKLHWTVIGVFKDQQEMLDAAEMFFQSDVAATERYADADLMIPGGIWNKQKWLEGGVTMVKMNHEMGKSASEIATSLQVDESFVADVILKLALPLTGSDIPPF